MEIRPILSALMRNKTGAVLVALQVAISLAILANALHIVNTRQAVAARPSGIADESSVFYVNTGHLTKGTPQLDLAIQQRETALLRALPGVASVAIVNQIPMSRSGGTTSVTVSRSQVSETAAASLYRTADSLVDTWQLKLIDGRDFTQADVLEYDVATSKDYPKVTIITKALADKAWPGAASVIGKTLFFGVGENGRMTQVIGVVERLQSQGAQVSERGEFAAILPSRALGTHPGATYTVRSEPGQRDRVASEAEQALRKNAGVPVVLKIENVSDDRIARYQADVALSWMLITVSALLLVITASGIVGMASLWVTQRRKQIGVRRALGARRTDILRYFVTENVMITGSGVLGGVLLAIGLNQLLVSQLEMTRLPLGYLLAGAGLLLALGIGAVYGPAWRAASISPALATRSA